MSSLVPKIKLKIIPSTIIPIESPKKIFFFPTKSITFLPPLNFSLTSCSVIGVCAFALILFAILSTSIEPFFAEDLEARNTSEHKS